MRATVVSRWLRGQREAIESSEGFRLVARARDETGVMANVVVLDCVPPYNFAELGRDLVERCEDGAPDADRVRLHLHLIHEDARTEFCSKVFRREPDLMPAGRGHGPAPTEAAMARLMGQHSTVMRLLIEACSEQYRISVESQQTQIGLVAEVKELLVELGHAESALSDADSRTLGDRIADVAELAIGHHLGLPLEDLVKMRQAVQIEDPDTNGRSRCSRCGQPGHNRRTCTVDQVDQGDQGDQGDQVDSLERARQWVRSMTPEELKHAIMNDAVIAPAVARAWSTKDPDTQST